MANKTLTEKRFNEILKKREQIFLKQRFLKLQKQFGKGFLYCWILGAIFFGLTFIVMLATSFSTSLLFFAKNGLWQTFNLTTGLYDFFSRLAFFFFIGAIVFKVIIFFHKKEGLKSGE